MKEIKFRGKRIDNNEWVYGNLIKTFDGKYFIDTQQMYNNNTDMWGINKLTLEVHEVLLKTIGQYTGIQDDNGVEIYNGDIVSMEPMLVSNEKTFKGIVKFSEGAYWIDNCKNAIKLFTECDKLKVLGDIYEKKEGQTVD